MQLTTEHYTDAVKHWPADGHHILAHQAGDQIVVYQAYKRSIAAFAVKHQYLGGSDYSYNRMSWIKPNFLWMMYRCGWAQKEGQERVLAIRIDTAHFERILSAAVLSTYHPEWHGNREAWQEALAAKEVRLQWDPDHDPHGGKETRRAIQLGLKGAALEAFGKTEVRGIDDVTDYVLEQWEQVKSNRLDQLLVPVERVYRPADNAIAAMIGLDAWPPV